MPVSPSSAARPSRRTLLGYAAVLVLAGFAAYHNSFRGPFVFDDIPAIVDNPSIRHLGNLAAVIHFDPGYGVTTSGRPLVNMSLALCYAISGTDVWSYHAFNLLIHLLAGLTLFGLVRRTLAGFAEASSTTAPAGLDRADGRTARPAVFIKPLHSAAAPLAFTTALLWLVHPLQTEAVTYVVQRTESMMGLFFLLTFYCFVRTVSSSRPWRWRGAIVMSCLAGALSKEVAAVVPPLLFLYDRTFVAGTFRAAWQRRRWLHLGVAAATWVPLALLLAGTGWNRGDTVGFNVGISAPAYWLTQFAALAHYLKLAVWPYPQSFEYGLFTTSLAGAAPYASIVLPLALATIVALRRWPAVGFLGAWFFAILAPTSLVPGAMQIVVEHRMYLPLAAVVAGVVVGTYAVFWSVAGPVSADSVSQAHRWAILRRFNLPLLVLALPLTFLTVRRNATYRDDLVLWQQTVATSPASAKAQLCLGTALYRRHRIREAAFHYRISLGLDPSRVLVHYNLALALTARGFPAEAETQCRAALRLNPNLAPAHYQLGLSLTALHRPQDAVAEFAIAGKQGPAKPEVEYAWGTALGQLGRWSEAVEHYKAALQADPAFTVAENDLGAALLRLGRVQEAMDCFQHVLRAKPDLPDAHFNLGLALARLGSTERATAEFAEAVRLDPANVAAQFNLGLALLRANRFADAIAPLQQVVRLRPAAADAQCDLGIALGRVGRLAEAADRFGAALQLQPGYVAAHYNLGCTLVELQRVAEGRQQLETALQLDPHFEPARAALERLP